MMMMSQRTAVGRKTGFLAALIPNPKERKIINIFIGITFFLLILGAYFIWSYYQTFLTWDFRRYKGLFKQFGSISEYGFFAVFALFPVFYLLKWKKVKTPEWAQIRTLLQFLAKYVRKWHVPVALVATGIVFLHGALAIIRGFKFDFTYLSGIVSLISLIPLIFMGFKRFKRNDRKWHLKLAIAFVALFLIHSSF